MVNLIRRINQVLDKYDTKMTYFISTYLIENRPDYHEHFENHDFAPHGHLHLDYTIVGKKAALGDMKNSVLVFKKQNLDPWVFRAPYGLTKIGNNSEIFFEYEKKLGILYDSSIRAQNPPPHPVKHKCGVTSMPFIGITDDYLIDDLKLNNNNEILRRFAETLEFGKNGVLVYDMHPIRMGQAKYIEIFEGLIKKINQKRNYMLTSLKESFSNFSKKDEDETLVCFTGDIDNLSMIDYFKRFKVF